MTAEREAIVRIAKRLTEAQRRILPSFSDWRSAFEAGLNSNNSLEVMRRQGLLVREGGFDGKLSPVTNYYYALSDIGIAVRDHLKESTHE